MTLNEQRAILVILEERTRDIKAQIALCNLLVKQLPAEAATPAIGKTAERRLGRPPGKRNLSPEARRRISQAQEKRWAEFRKNNGTDHAANPL
jgi:hypothetical protein